MRIYIIGGIMAGAGGLVSLALNALGAGAFISAICAMPVGVVLMWLYDYDGEL